MLPDIVQAYLKSPRINCHHERSEGSALASLKSGFLAPKDGTRNDNSCEYASLADEVLCIATFHALLWSGQRADDLAVLRLRKRPQGFCAHVAQRADREREPCAGGIVGKFRDEHGVIPAHGQVPAVNLSIRRFGGFPRSVQP